MNRKIIIGVIGGNSATPHELDIAYQVGKWIAQHDYVLLNGGHKGIMEAACKGSSENNGLTLCVLPEDNKEAANPYCNIIIPTGIGFARNLITAIAGDIVVAIGGGAGTLSELALAWHYCKPILAYLDDTPHTSQQYAKLKKLDEFRNCTTITPFSNIKEFEIKINNFINNINI